MTEQQLYASHFLIADDHEKKCRLIIIFTNHPLSLTGNKATKVDIRQNIVRLKLKTDTKKTPITTIDVF